MDSTVKVIEFVTPKSKYTIFYYKIPVSFGSPHVHLTDPLNSQITVNSSGEGINQDK